MQERFKDLDPEGLTESFRVGSRGREDQQSQKTELAQRPGQSWGGLKPEAELGNEIELSYTGHWRGGLEGGQLWWSISKHWV